MKSTIDICIGDFGVATVMGDARTKTRTMVGSMNWMAPEVRTYLIFEPTSLQKSNLLNFKILVVLLSLASVLLEPCVS